MIILDTDHISALQYRYTPKAFALQVRLETFPPEEVAPTVITVEEQMRSWLGLIRRLTDAQRQVAYYEGHVMALPVWYIRRIHVVNKGT